MLFCPSHPFRKTTDKSFYTEHLSYKSMPQMISWIPNSVLLLLVGLKLDKDFCGAGAR